MKKTVYTIVTAVLLLALTGTYAMQSGDQQIKSEQPESQQSRTQQSSANAVEIWYDEGAGDVLARVNRLDMDPIDLHYGFDTLEFQEFAK